MSYGDGWHLLDAIAGRGACVLVRGILEGFTYISSDTGRRLGSRVEQNLPHHQFGRVTLKGNPIIV